MPETNVPKNPIDKLTEEDLNNREKLFAAVIAQGYVDLKNGNK